MDNVRTTRDMEECLLNPTIPTTAMEGDPGPALVRPDSNVSDITRPDSIDQWKGYNKTAPAPAAHTLKCAGWQGYASDEEPASPVATDDMSLHSTSSLSLASIASGESLPESLEKSGDDAEQRCNKAQAVRVVVAGKAKVVSMPKLVEDGIRSKRPAAIASTAILIRRSSSKGSSDSGSQSSSLDSRRGTPRTSAEDSSPSSPTSTAPSSVDQDDVPPTQPKSSLRRRPSLPQLVTALSQPPTPGPMPNAEHVRQTVEFWERQQPPEPASRRQSTPMSPGIRKLHKLSSSLAMNFFKKDGKQPPRGTKIREVLHEMPQPPSLASAPAGMPKPKMVPRGANERAPPIVLPPCPEGYQDNPMVTQVPQFPVRNDSYSIIASGEKSTKLHHRQRSISIVVDTATA